MRCDPAHAPAPLAAMTSAMATLFAFTGWKRKTEETSAEELAAAKNARLQQDEKAVNDRVAPGR